MEGKENKQKEKNLSPGQLRLTGSTDGSFELPMAGAKHSGPPSGHHNGDDDLFGGDPIDQTRPLYQVWPVSLSLLFFAFQRPSQLIFVGCYNK